MTVVMVTVMRMKGIQKMIDNHEYTEANLTLHQAIIPKIAPPLKVFPSATLAASVVLKLTGHSSQHIPLSYLVKS